MSEKVITTNRRAFHDYQILDRIEAGIVLQGTEVKSLRAGNITLKDAFAQVREGEMYLVNAHIKPYEQGNIYNHDPDRDRKLLLHKEEIIRLGSRIQEKGLTLVPLRMYFKRGRVKVELGLCKGKRAHDKRAALREREVQKEMDRAIREFRGR
jgi:SsrA-binding protein